MAEYEGELYYLGVQPESATEWRAPMLGHRVLIEGTVTDAYRICGGVVLRPVVTSVIAELDATCNTIPLPALDQYTVPFARQLESKPAEKVQPASSQDPGTYTVQYEFDSARLLPAEVARIEQVLRTAAAFDSLRIDIVGSRGATALSNGSVLVEVEDIAERRATRLMQLMLASAIPRDRIDVRWEKEVPAADGVDDFVSRRATITLRPVIRPTGRPVQR